MAERLRDLRTRLLQLHRLLLDDERGAYEATYGPVGGPELLQLLLRHEQFAWLRSLSAMISAIRDAKTGNAADTECATARVGDGVNILLVDHEDSFVHTLANYFRQTGANVSTVRTPVPDEVFDRLKPNLVVLSPGPGTPKDFDCAATMPASPIST